MAQRTPEPTTEQEARRIEAFLKGGAETTLEVVQTFRAEPATVDLERPGTLAFPVLSRDASTQLGQEGDLRALLAVDLADVENVDDFFVHLFINQVEATTQTSPGDPHFAGGLAFFCQAEDQDGRLVCIPGDSPRRFLLDVTPVLRKVGDVDDALRVTVVLVPFPDRTAKSRTMSVTGAELNISQSVVK